MCAVRVLTWTETGNAKRDADAIVRGAATVMMTENQMRIAHLRAEGASIMDAHRLPNFDTVTTIGYVPSFYYDQAVSKFEEANKLERSALNFWIDE